MLKRPTSLAPRSEHTGSLPITRDIFSSSFPLPFQLENTLLDNFILVTEIQGGFRGYPACPVYSGSAVHWRQTGRHSVLGNLELPTRIANGTRWTCWGSSIRCLSLSKPIFQDFGSFVFGCHGEVPLRRKLRSIYTTSHDHRSTFGRSTLPRWFTEF